MEIVKYSEQYEQDVIDMVSKFFEESLREYQDEIDLEAVNESIANYRDNSFLLLIDDKPVGMLAGIDITTPFNNDRVYQNMVWYVKPEHRAHSIDFLREAEKLLLKQGFAEIIISCLHNQKKDLMFALFQRGGYKAIETHFMKRLKL